MTTPPTETRHCDKCDRDVTTGCNYCACPFPAPQQPEGPAPDGSKVPDGFTDIDEVVAERESTPEGKAEMDAARVRVLRTALAEAQATIAARDARIAELETALREADQYLSSNDLNYIGSGSQLHRQFKAALQRKEGA